MGLFERLGFQADQPKAIDWNLTPADTFAIFESWGGSMRVRSKSERYYYFYINGWDSPAQLYLMERGIKFARVLARIDAPQEMIDGCVQAQGRAVSIDRAYAIDGRLKQWLRDNVVDGFDPRRVIPLLEEEQEQETDWGLPRAGEMRPGLEKVRLSAGGERIGDQQIAGYVRERGLFDSRLNPSGDFSSFLVDNGDGRTVTDLANGLTWQAAGSEIGTLVQMERYVKALNERRWAGYADWRLPSVAEALSLLEKKKNDQGLHLHRRFNPAQPFIFTANRRHPGGVWFVDFMQGRVFWASTSNPGGYARVCRSEPG